MMKILYLVLLILTIPLIMCRKTPDEIPNNNNTEINMNPENTTDIKEINAGELFLSSENEDVDELSVELLEFDKTGINIAATDNNKFIGYVDFYEVYPELHIGDIYIYEKFIVLEEHFQNGKNWYMGGFNVYEYNEEIKYSEYKIKGKKLYGNIGEPYRFKGISGDLVFSDIGTGHGIGGVEVFDLVNNTIVLKGGYYEHFMFSDNVLYGLVLTEWDVANENPDDYLLQMYYEYLKKTEKPEEKEEYKGLFQEFILQYDYNIQTKEVTGLSGEYIYVP